MIARPWVFKARHGLWYFTIQTPYSGIEYRTFSHDLSGVMYEENDMGTIGTAASDKIHRSFKQFSLEAVFT